MAWGLGIHVANRSDGSSQDRVFPAFPVRVGRNALNDLVLNFPFVSQFHLVLELQDGRLFLRDLGSTNGTIVRGLGRAPANQLVDLAAYGFEFSILNLEFRTYTAVVDNAAAPVASHRRPLRVTDFLNSVNAMDVAQALALADAAGGVTDQHRGLYVKYRSAYNELFASITEAINRAPVTSRAQLIGDFSRQMDALGREPEFLQLCAQQGAAVPPQGGDRSSRNRLEDVALQGIRELANDFCPGAGPLESVPDLVRFAERLQQVLDLFLRSFIPLRDGQRQFEQDMAVRRQSSAPVGVSTVASAQNPQELGQALLDWRRAVNDDFAQVEHTFADLMIHQVALLSGVMTGVRSLLAQLSPEELERKAQDPHYNPDGLGIGPYRYKSLWKVFEKLHADVASEDKQVFGVLFGRDFAQSYQQSFGASSGVAPVARNPTPMAPGGSTPR